MSAVKVCVLIPAFNEERVIRRTIIGAYNAGFDRKDVFVVDDGSSDDTAKIAAHYKCNVVTKVNGGKGAALRFGMEHFRLAENYTHVAILDADSKLDKGYLEAMMNAIAKHPETALFCGHPRSIAKPWNWITAYRAVEYAVSAWVYREAQHITGAMYVAPGCASVYRADIFDSLDKEGGTIVEDMDMTMQLQRRREKIVFVPKAHVHTQDPRTLKGFIGQSMRWARGTWQVIWKHRIGRQMRTVDAEVGFLAIENILTGIFVTSMPFWAFWYPKLALICILGDQGIHLVYTTLTAIKERRPELILFFPTFFFLRLIGYYIFLLAFLLERRTVETKWYSVERY